MPPRVPLEIADNFLGVNRRQDRQAISRRELYTAQNFYPATQGIAETRLGATRFNATVWPNASAGRACIRFYPDGGTARKIAAFNVAGGDQIVYGDDVGATLTEMVGATALSANKQWLFTVFQSILYMGNGTETIQKSTNGTTRVDIAGSPAPPIGFPAGPYRYRLLMFGDPNHKKYVWYTNTFCEDVPITNYRVVEHPEDVSAAAVFGRDEDRGIFGDLAIFTPTSTWIQRDDFGASGSSWDRATDRIGCPSPLTLEDTPYGLIGLGYDGTTDLIVFIIPVGGGRPIVISENIRLAEVIPLQQRLKACAKYHAGFYRLSFPPSGQSTPTRQWWADLRSFSLSAANLGIRWWGPMIGQTIGCFAVQDQATDTNQLFGVDGAAGYLNNLDVADTYTDYTTAYTAILSTKYLDGGDPLHMKVFSGFILGARPNADENVSVDSDVDESAATATSTVTMEVTAPVVADATLVSDDTIVGGARYDEYVKQFPAALYGHRIAHDITYSGGRQFSIKRVTPIGTKGKRLFK